MKLVFACLAVLFLASAAARPKRKKLTVAEVFQKAGITELLNIDGPENLLEVIYGSIRVNLGNEIYPGKTTNLPTIKFEDADPDAYYTWLMLDPDVNSSGDEELLRNVAVYAIIVNIQDNDLACGYELSKFVNANPRPGTGLHNFVYLYYRQKEEIDTSSCDIPVFGNNRNFNLTEFTEEFEFCGLEAGNFHSAQFPDNLLETCKDEGYFK